MKNKIQVTLCSLAIAMPLTVFADNGYHSQSHSQISEFSYQNGYSSSGHSSGPHVSFSVSTSPYFIVQAHRHIHRPALNWVKTGLNAPMPRDAVIGGSEQSNRALYICRVPHKGSMHPGKVVNGYCHISWGGQELRFPRYEVLTSRIPLQFIPSNHGLVPANALYSGYENGKPLFICQAAFNNGMHPGKVIGPNCNIAYDGKEHTLAYYNVLVR